MLSSSSTSTETDIRRTRLAGGGATHLSSHARHPRPATSDKTKGSQALARPTASKRVSSPPVGTFSTASDATDTTNPNSKPRSDSAASRDGEVPRPTATDAQPPEHRRGRDRRG